MMNKKYIVGGLIFWAGLSGYMGLRILESYTEDAVFAALSVIPAQAQEIRYSFLRNTLTLKGVEYELPDEKVMHKGSIEKVEVQGFNRKCMFVKPNMPAYDADTLPIVAESVSATGIADRIHFGNTQLEQKIADVQIRGWYQRLGMLLDQRSRHRGEASYYEELYRIRLDGLEVNGVNSVLTEPELSSPVTMVLDKVALAQGIRAPRGAEKVSPVSLYLSGFRFTGKDVSGALQRMDVRDLLLPQPETMAALVRLYGQPDDKADAEKKTEQTPPPSQEELLNDALDRLYADYAHRLPYTLFGMQGMNVAFRGQPFPVSLSLNGLACTRSMVDKDTVKAGTDLSGLRVRLPEKGDKTFTIISRYAPEGLGLNVKAETLTGRNEISGTARYEVEGLGVLEAEGAISGDIAALGTTAFADPAVSALEMLQKLSLKSFACTYKDSGLLPMVLELAAWHDFETPEDYLAMMLETGNAMEQAPDRLVREVGVMLKEQCTMPGEVGVTFTSAQPVSLMDVANRLLMNPAAVPLSVTSKPGTKPLTDYLPEGKTNE